MNIEKLTGQNNQVKNEPEVSTGKYAPELSDVPSFGEFIQSTAEQKQEQELNQSSLPALVKAKAGLARNLQDLILHGNQPNGVIKGIRLSGLNKKGDHEALSLDLSSLKKDDIEFFKMCVDNPAMLVSQMNNQDFQLNFSIPGESGQISYKSLNLSKDLFNLIEKAYQNQKPIRLDFEGNSSVILRIDAQGRLGAEFMSSDKAMESLLKSSIPNLAHKFDTEEIPYTKIIYKDNNKKHDKKEQKGD